MTAPTEPGDAGRLQLALADGDAAWRILVDDNPLPVVLFAAATLAPIAWNPAAEALYGCALGGLTSVADLATPDARAAWAHELARPAVGRTSHGAWPHRRGDGATLVVDVVAHDLQLGETAARLAVLTDATERAALQAQLRQAQKMGALGQLAGNVAHDFNNLLTAILASVQLADEALGAGHAARDELEVIGRAARRAAELTGQLLTVSRKRPPVPEVIDLNALIAEPVQLLRRLVGARVELRVAVAPGVWPVRADPGQVEQVLLNFVVNARDAMPDGGVLTISTANRVVCDPPPAHLPGLPAGEYAALAVHDTGVGMDDATLGRVFEPFFTTKPPGQGTGLGLSTVYGIAKQWGGYVYGESTVGRGSAFSMLLPRAT